MARVFGVAAPPLDSCSVLEIGCGSGGNLLAMAATMPGAELIGVDISEGELSRARETAAAAELGNVRFAPETPPRQFEYVIMHGVLSWVTPDTRRRLLRQIADVLAPHGVAYVSYNVLPGFALRSTVRDMLRYHAQDGSEAERIAAARTMLSWMSARVARDGGAYRVLIDEEQERLALGDDAYLFHEHLEEDNHALWFHELVAEARAVGLDWLAEADPAATVRRTPRAHAAIAAIAGSDPVRIEQYFDFMRGRSFRASLLVRTAPGAPLLGGLHAVSSGPGELHVGDDVRTALDRLAAVYPDTLPVEALGVDPNALLPLHGASLLELRARPLSLGASSASWTSPLARYQSLRPGPVTNLRHEPIPLAEPERQLLSVLSRPDARELLGARFPFEVTLATLARLAFLRASPP